MNDEIIQWLTNELNHQSEAEREMNEALAMLYQLGVVEGKMVNGEPVFGLAEINKHDPSALLGDHGEVFYSLKDFPTTNNEVGDAFHGQTQEGDETTIKPFFKESVGNSLTICTWCYISSTFTLKKLHTTLRTWLIQKQLFIEPIHNG